MKKLFLMVALVAFIGANSGTQAAISTDFVRVECEKCGYRFSTVEEVELLDISVIKRDGRREPYDREKIMGGLRKALEKRPVSDEDIRGLIGHIERSIQKKRQREIKSSEIGEIIMDRLKRFDKVAYIRFASVYRQFEDVETFQKELRGLVGTKAMIVRKRRSLK